MKPQPYNTDTPYTAEDLERFNRYTNFPKDRDRENAAFAALSREERTRAAETLQRYGKQEMPDDVSRALERLRRARYQVFMTSIRSREIAPPWSVVGPARYSAHANPDRAHRMLGRAYEEYNNARAALEHRLRRHGPTQVIRSDQPTAVELLEARIGAAQRHQEKMKRANAIIREEGKDESWKLGRLETECGLDSVRAMKLLKPDFVGRVGYADYVLSNHSANLRRMRDRLESLKAERVRESVTFHFPGGRVEDHAADCRVRIYHDEKPGPEVIAKLKANGFHWSPRLVCWQRLRNHAARQAATVVAGVPWPKLDSPQITIEPVPTAPAARPRLSA